MAPAAYAAYKDLSMDAADPHVLGRFWAAVLGRDLELLDDGDVVLRGPTPQHTVWVNRVPEPKLAKHRVHLDVHTRSIAALRRLGAEVVQTFPRWTVLTDPEGGEFCAFVRASPPADRLYELVLDAADPPAVAAWWAAVLGGRLVAGEGFTGGRRPGYPTAPGPAAATGFSWVEQIPGAPFESLVVMPAPEPKRVKNRVHLDVVGDVRAITGRGATIVAEHARWTVLMDPWGNEFCVFPH